MREHFSKFSRIILLPCGAVCGAAVAFLFVSPTTTVPIRKTWEKLARFSEEAAEDSLS